jgi:hypothetical protein
MQVALITLFFISSSKTNYSAKPWDGKPQQIPGKIQSELHDAGTV